MSKIAMMGTFTCVEGKAEQTEALLARMVAASDDEPGVDVYAYFRGHGGTFWFFGLMADEASLHGHGRSEAMQAVMAEFRPLVDVPPQMSMVTPVASRGLPV